MGDKLSVNPGPGQYDLDVRLSKSPQYSFPKKKKEIIINNNVNYTMSSPVGNFNPKRSFDNNKVFSGSHKASKSETGQGEYLSNKAALPASSVPGPGAYSTLKDKLSKTQTFM